jgi:hypothetical protein
MNENTIKILRLTGIAGVIAALSWIIGDVLLLGAEATAEEFPILAQFAGSSNLTAQVVQSGAQFFGSTPERLAAGALIAVLTTPLYLAGIWHIYLALKPAGKWSSTGPLLLLAAAYSIAPFVHGSFYYVAEMVKLLPVVGTTAQVYILEAATRVTIVLFGTYSVLAILTVAGFIWMIITVAKGKSLYPRWVAIANLLLFMVLGSFLDQFLPYPLSLWLEGAGLNIGMFIFFVFSLSLLWNGLLRDPGRRHHLTGGRCSHS